MTATTTTPTAQAEVDWYRLSPDEVCQRLEVDPAVGLSTAEVTERRFPAP